MPPIPFKSLVLSDESSVICDMSGGMWEVVVGAGRMALVVVDDDEYVEAAAAVVVVVVVVKAADDDNDDNDDEAAPPVDFSPSFSSPKRPIFAGN